MARLLLLLLVLVAVDMACTWPAAAHERNAITHIKGFEGPLPFYLESGYVEVDDTHGAELFYYFIQSERSPMEDPLILWITGGPGCSALSGLLFEIGPLKFDVAGYTEGFPRLVYFEDSWTKVSNNALQDIDLLTVTAGINPTHVLEPWCGLALRERDPAGGDTVFTNRARLLLQDSLQEHKLGLPVECRDNGYRLSNILADDAEVRETLGIRDGSIGPWSRCITLTHFRHDVPSSIQYHANLTRRGYRVLVYNGDHDLDFTFVGTQAWIRTLGYPVVAPWRPWYSNRQVAGYTTEYAYNLTYATVKGAGHTAPEYRPKECLDMLRRWTSPAGKL